jgi:hypothetical protein
MMMESNKDIIASLKKFYSDFAQDSAFPANLGTSCAEDLKRFGTGLDQLIDEFKLHISRAQLLGKVISDRKELVNHPINQMNLIPLS